MSQAEQERAANQVKESVQEFDHAIEQLKDRLATSVERASGLVNSIKKPKQQFEDFIDSKLQSVEGFVADNKVKIERTLSGAQDSANQVLKAVSDRPVAIWFVVFISGWILGDLWKRSDLRKSNDLGSSTPGQDKKFGTAA